MSSSSINKSLLYLILITSSGGWGPPGRAEAPRAGGADGPGDWSARGEMAVEKLEATVGREKEGMWALRQVE